MLHYWYQPLITINKSEIQRFGLSCLELNIEGLSAKAEGLSPVDNTLRDLYIFISYESRIQ